MIWPGKSNVSSPRKSHKMKFNWKAKFKIDPSLRMSKEINDYYFHVQNNETTVTVQYETSKYDELHPNRKNNNEYAEETLAQQEKAKIKEILLRRMVYQLIFSPLRIKLISYPELLNRKELEEKNIKLRREITATFEAIYSILDVNDSISESEQFWYSNFNGSSSGHQEAILNIAAWLSKSELEQRSINKFILTWIAFNSLYGLCASIFRPAQSMTEIDQFSLTIDNLLTPEKASNILNEFRPQIIPLTTLNLTSRNGGVNYSNDLNEEIEKISTNNELEIIKYALKCIYMIRNQYFHNAPQVTELQTNIGNFRNFIMRITAWCMRNFIKSCTNRPS